MNKVLFLMTLGIIIKKQNDLKGIALYLFYYCHHQESTGGYRNNNYDIS